MRDHAGVTRKQLRTSNYSPEARARLGEAVEAARNAAGYRYRTDFCRAHNIRSGKSLELLELGKTGVGQMFLYEVADALPNWDRETPRTILEGGPIPPLEGVEPQGEEPPADPSDLFSPEVNRAYDAIAALASGLGIPPTDDNVDLIRELARRVQPVSQAAETATTKHD